MRGEALRLQTLQLSSYLLDFIQYIYPHILTLWLSIRYGILGGPTAACSIWMSPLGDISTILVPVIDVIDVVVLVVYGFVHDQVVSRSRLLFCDGLPFSFFLVRPFFQQNAFQGLALVRRIRVEPRAR